MRNGTYVPPNYDPDVDAYITYNYSLGWEVSDALKATFGIRNLLDTDPPFTLRYLDHGDGAAWESRVADPRGRSEEHTSELQPLMRNSYAVICLTKKKRE